MGKHLKQIIDGDREIFAQLMRVLYVEASFVVTNPLFISLHTNAKENIELLERREQKYFTLFLNDSKLASFVGSQVFHQLFHRQKAFRYNSTRPIEV